MVLPIYNVIQISSFLEYQVDDTKCKTVFKNSISTSMETQVWKHKETQVWKHKEIETQIAFIRKNLSCLYENFERGSPITICFVFKRWIKMNFCHATWNCHLLFIIRLLFGFVSDLKGLPKPSQSLSNSTKISTNTQMPMLSRWTVSVLYIFSEINLQLHRQSPLFLNTNYENSYRSIYSRKRLILTFPHTFRCNKKGTGESKK